MEINIQPGGRPRKPETPLDFIMRLLINGIAVFITSYLLRGVHVDSIFTALLVAGALALLNAFVRPLIILLTIPLTIFSFGLFLIVINAIIIELTTEIVSGFRVDGFWWAVAFSLVLWLVNSLFERIRKRFIKQEDPGENNPDDRFDDYIEVKEEDNDR